MVNMDICIWIIDTLCCTEETNAILVSQLYSDNFFNQKKNKYNNKSSLDFILFFF